MSGGDAASRSNRGEDMGTRPAMGRVQHGRRTGYGAGPAGRQCVAKRGFPGEMVRRGGVEDGRGVYWPQEMQPTGDPDAEGGSTAWRCAWAL
jgi:hypothetical protein